MKKKIIAASIILAFTFSACTGIISWDSNGSEDKKPEPSGKEISVYRDDAKLYYSYQLGNAMNIKLYHLGNDDVPYISSDTASKIYNKVSDISTVKSVKDSNGKYTIKRGDFSLFTLDVGSQTLTVHKDITQGISYNTESNNGVLYDPCYSEEVGHDSTTNKDIMRTSNKSKYLYDGKDHVVKLYHYDMEIVEKDNDVYAPLYVYSILNELASGNYVGGGESFLCNGKDIFLSNAAATIASSMGNSSNGSFNFPFAYGEKGDLADIQLEKKTAPGGSKYYFEGSIDKEAYGAEEAYKFELTLNSSNQGTLVTKKENGESASFDTFTRDITYEVDSASSRILVKCAVKQSTTVKYTYYFGINLDQTYYGQDTISETLLNYEMNSMKLYFKEFYGIADSQNRDFDARVNAQNVKNDLKDRKAIKYDNAFAKVLLKEIADGHTGLNATSFFTGQKRGDLINYQSQYQSNRDKKLSDKITEYRNLRKNALGETFDAYKVVGDTAIITFDSFTITHCYHALNYYSSIDPNDIDNDTSYLIGASMYRISTNSAIKNVVIDISCNGGGQVAVLPLILAMMSKDPIVLTASRLDYSLREYHYSFDLNGDNTFEGEGDSFQEKYKFFVLTSEYSFSCSTFLASSVKNMGVAKVIGKPSGGGSQMVGSFASPLGMQFQCSSSEGTMLKDKSQGIYRTTDHGVPVDYEIDPSLWYDRTALVNKINSLGA